MKTKKIVKRNAFNLFITISDQPFYFTPGKKLKAQEVLQKLNFIMKNLENFIITSDVGNHQMYICQFIQFKKPKHFFSSGSLGCKISSVG